MNYYPNKPGNQLILDMINDRFGTSYTVGQLTLGNPVATTTEGRNTEVTVGVTTGPLVNQITKALYNRLNLSTLFQNMDKNIVDSQAGFVNISEVLPYFESTYGIVIQPTDIVDGPVGTGPYPRSFTIQAANNSFAYLGNVVFNLTENPAVVGPSWAVSFSANENLAFDYGDGTFLTMTPNGESVPGDYMYLVEFLNVGGNWGRYRAGIRFTPLPLSDNIQPTNDNVASIELPDANSFWALDVIVANDQRPVPEPFTAEEMPFGGGMFELRMTLQVDSLPPITYAGTASGGTFRWRVVDGFGYADVEYVEVESISGGREAVISAQARFTEAFIGSQVVGEQSTSGGVLLGDISVSFSIVEPATGAVLAEMPEAFIANIAEGSGGEGSGPNSWTLSNYSTGFFGDDGLHGVNGDLYMLPNGEAVDGDNFSVVEIIDQRNVAQPFGRYRTGIRFSTTPVPESPVAPTGLGTIVEPVYNLQLPTTATPWAVDVVVNQDFGLTNADPFNGPLNGFEYSINVSPDSLGVFYMRAVVFNDGGVKKIQFRRVTDNALVKEADHVIYGAAGSAQEGNIVGFQVRFDHALLLSRFPAVETTASDIPYGNWYCRVEFLEPGVWSNPNAFTMPFGGVNAVITLP